MAYTTDQLSTLEQAIASGTQTVRFADGKTIVYQSLSEMVRLRDSIQAELGVTVTHKRAKIFVPVAGDGL